MAVKRRSATATLGFAILGPRCSRSAQVGVEELLEARERLVDDGRLLAEALDDDHVQFLLWVHRQSHGHRPNSIWMLHSLRVPS